MDRVKKSKLYQPSGYPDIEYLLNKGLPFMWLIGGRGIGKTYTILETIVLNRHTKFILLRRKASEVKKLSTEAFNVFKKLNSDKGIDIRPYPNGDDCYSFYYADEDGKAWGECLGYMMSLSTFANFRGGDMTDIDFIIQDEAIPQTLKGQSMNGEAFTFFNAYETINRNRELECRPALRVISICNSTILNNDYFLTLNMISPIMEMYRNKKELKIDREHERLIALYLNSPISERKKKTALYKYTKDTAFANQAIDNLFEDMDSFLDVSRPLAEYIPVATIGEITIYRHKSRQKPYYLSTHKSGAPKEFKLNEYDILVFRNKYRSIVNAVYFGEAEAEKGYLLKLLLKYIKMY